jgi:hypothetical protein
MTDGNLQFAIPILQFAIELPHDIARMQCDRRLRPNLSRLYAARRVPWSAAGSSGTSISFHLRPIAMPSQRPCQRDSQ